MSAPTWSPKSKCTEERNCLDFKRTLSSQSVVHGILKWKKMILPQAWLFRDWLISSKRWKLVGGKFRSCLTGMETYLRLKYVLYYDMHLIFLLLRKSAINGLMHRRNSNQHLQMTIKILFYDLEPKEMLGIDQTLQYYKAFCK